MHQAAPQAIPHNLASMKSSNQPHSSLTHVSGLSIQQKPVGGEVEAGAQVKQQFNMACVQDFTEAPMLHIQFMYGHMTSH